MKKYSITLSSHIPHETKIKVYELCKNGKSLFEEYFYLAKKDEKQLNELAVCLRIIESAGNMQRHPKTKFREIKDLNLNCKVYESKSGNTRIYLFHEEKTGRIIVTGGSKNNQPQDIKKIKLTIKEYFNEK